jgi:drug/metabolite transporter (DMT)-like permease
VSNPGAGIIAGRIRFIALGQDEIFRECFIHVGIVSDWIRLMAFPGSARSPQTSSAENITTGILLMVGAIATFTIIDACAKFLIGSVPPMMVVFARYGLSLFYVVGLMWWTGALTLRSDHRSLQILRGVLLFASTLLNFLALQYLRLDQTSAIFFSNPLWVCALSPILLGERIGPRRWAAVIVGFLGVLLIIRPGNDGFHWAMLLSVTVAILTALYQIITRKIGGRDPALVSLLLPSMVGTALAMPLGLFNWYVPAWGQVALMLLMGFAGGVGHHLLIKAHTLAPAPTLAPFIYTQIIWMIIVGYVVFGDVPDFHTLFGAFIVVSSGLYVYYREQAVKRKSARQTDRDQIQK